MSEIATVSSIISSAPDLNGFLLNLWQYLLTPAIILSILPGVLAIGRKIGRLEHEFVALQKSNAEAQRSLNSLQRSATQLNSCVVEIQSFLRVKHRSASLVENVLNVYGQANSPIALKPQYQKWAKESGLDLEVLENKEHLVEWLRAAAPETGLDAQNMILEFVIGGEIETMISTRAFKEFVYQKGLTSQDYEAILSLYLFEALIPEVFLQD